MLKQTASPGMEVISLVILFDLRVTSGSPNKPHKVFDRK